MRPINDLPTFEEMLQAERAVVFLFVPWSIQAKRARSIVEQLERDWQADAATPGYGSSWWELSADGSFGSVKVFNAAQKWLNSEIRDADYLLNGGNGPVLWCRRGRVLNWLTSAEWVDRLRERNRNAFDPPPPRKRWFHLPFFSSKRLGGNPPAS